MERIASDKVLEEARRLLEKEGWIQGDFHRTGEGYCALGALRQVVYEGYCVVGAGHHMCGGSAGVIFSEAYQRLQSQVGGRGTVAWWNDRPERTAEDVIMLFEKALCDERISDGQ